MAPPAQKRQMQPSAEVIMASRHAERSELLPVDRLRPRFPLKLLMTPPHMACPTRPREEEKLARSERR